jgi:hypothetical protein
MSSLLTSISQIDTSVKYLKALGTTTIYTPTTSTSVTAVMTTSGFTAATTISTYVSGTLFRDMGKNTITYGTNGLQVAKYVLVQPQLGGTTEGVPPNYSTQKFYVQVWAAETAATAVTVARVG